MKESKLTTDSIKNVLVEKYNQSSSTLKRIKKFKNESEKTVRVFNGSNNQQFVVISDALDLSIQEVLVSVSLDNPQSTTQAKEPIAKKSGGIDPQEWFFYLYKSKYKDEDQYVWFVKKKKWNRDFCFDDQNQTKLEKFLTPYGFSEATESCFEHWVDDNPIDDIVKARDLLVKLGFTENPDCNRGDKESCSILYPFVNKNFGEA